MSKICDCKNKNREKILQYKNVVGIGVGHKITNGKDTGKQCITVLVHKKENTDQLKGNILPKRLNGYLVDVVEVGNIKAEADHKKKYRPPKGGVSIGFSEAFVKSAGTLGMFVKKKNDNRRLILSNRHVLIDTRLETYNDPILQPGTLDGGSFNSVIGYTLEQVPLLFNGPENKADAALGVVTEDSISTAIQDTGKNFLNNFFRSILNFLKILFSSGVRQPKPPIIEADSIVTTNMLGIGNVINHAFLNPEIGSYAQKSGRTTGWTEGTLIAKNVDLWVGYDEEGDAYFKDQYVFSAMSAAGDSGSVILDEDNRVTALLFAGSESTTIGNPIKNVIDALDLDFKEE